MTKHILMVEDDALMRRVPAFNLEEANYRASTAASAEDAVVPASRAIDPPAHIATLTGQPLGLSPCKFAPLHVLAQRARWEV